MSYILDALKKSEKQRQQEKESPIIHTAQPVPPKSVGGGLSKSWLLIPGGLLAIAIIGYSFSSRNSPSQSPTAPIQQPAAEAAAAKPAKTIAAAGAAETAPTPARKTPAAVEAIPAVGAPPVPELRPSAIKIASRKSVAAASPVVQSASADEPEAVPTDEQGDTPGGGVPLLEELNPTVRQSIPEFRLAGHVYSPDPLLRMIIINNRVVRQNDVVEKGFVLEEITMDGVVLRKGDVRFRIVAE